MTLVFRTSNVLGGQPLKNWKRHCATSLALAIWGHTQGRRNNCLETVVQYNSIQVLRCLAVLALVISHSNVAVDQPVFLVPFFSEFGWMGVRLFFVVSGFIIAERIGLERSLGRYLEKRYRCVFPLYALITVVSLVLTRGFDVTSFSLAQTDSGGPFDPTHWSYVLKSVFIIPQDSWPVFGVGWSLEYELVFYLTFGLAFFLGGRRAAMITMLLLSLVGMALSTWTRPLFDPLFTYFLLGCVAREVLALNRQFLIKAAPYVFVASTIIWILNLYRIVDLGEIIFVLVSGLSFAALIVFVASLEKSQKAFQQKGILTLIGDMSFSVYLVHWLVIPICGALTNGVTLSTIEAEVIRALAVVVSLGASWIIWKYLEGPLSRTRSKARAPTQSPTPGPETPG